MSVISLPRAHQAQLEKLTGVRYATLLSPSKAVRAQLLKGRGRPFKHSVLVMLALALKKLRLNLSVRALEALTGIDSVTVSRCVLRVTAALGELPLAQARGGLVVDSTHVRAATTERSAYSGYKHHRCAKVQLIAQPDGQVVAVSRAVPGSVHDKTLWNKERHGLKHLVGHLVLADKAYVGASGEGEQLVRPVKRGERAYLENPEKAKAFNRALSKTRVRVEHVFARLKTWRVLSGLFPYRWPRLGEVVRALAVVLNADRTAPESVR
jgi:hypothetical protein